jgi:hypothetical protein
MGRSNSMPNVSDQLSDHYGMACYTPSTTDKRAGRRLTEKVEVLIVVLLDNLDADDDVERPPEDFDGRNINRLGRDDADGLKLDLGRGGRARVEVAEGGDQGERAGQVGVVGEQGADRELCGHGGVDGGRRRRAEPAPGGDGTRERRSGERVGQEDEGKSRLGPGCGRPRFGNKRRAQLLPLLTRLLSVPHSSPPHFPRQPLRSSHAPLGQRFHLH